MWVQSEREKWNVWVYCTVDSRKHYWSLHFMHDFLSLSLLLTLYAILVLLHVGPLSLTWTYLLFVFNNTVMSCSLMEYATALFYTCWVETISTQLFLHPSRSLLGRQCHLLADVSFVQGFLNILMTHASVSHRSDISCEEPETCE